MCFCLARVIVIGTRDYLKSFELRHEKICFFCICENKDADQLRGNRKADQRICFRYMDSTIPLLAKSEISSLWLYMYSPVCVEPGQKPRRLVFSQRGSFLSFRAEKSEVLSDDLQSSEKKVDTAKHVYTTTCKKVSASLLSTGTNDLDKRIVSSVSFEQTI